MAAPSWLRSWRFLFSRRWVLFFLAVILIGYGTWWLGEWQFNRLDDRKEHNAIVRANEQKTPAPVTDVMSPGGTVDADDEWRLIEATGTYAVDDTVIVRYRTDDDGQPGIDAVVPLVLSDGTALLVDRGWYPSDDPRVRPDVVPDPPSGEVTVTGWVRIDGTGDSTKVIDRSTRAISSRSIGAALDRVVLGGFIDLKSETPEPEEPLQTTELPDLGNGPHFFYGLQWWFFGILAAGGFGYLAWDERRNGKRGDRGSVRRGGPFKGGPFKLAPREPIEFESPGSEIQSERVAPPSTGSDTPVRNDAAGESTNAATRPNSSGSP